MQLQDLFIYLYFYFTCKYFEFVYKFSVTLLTLSFSCPSGKIKKSTNLIKHFLQILCRKIGKLILNSHGRCNSAYTKHPEKKIPLYDICNIFDHHFKEPFTSSIFIMHCTFLYQHRIHETFPVKICL